MKARRGVALGVVFWVVVVVLGASLVWAVISRAGVGVTGAVDAPAAAASSASSSRPATRRPGRTSSRSASGSTDSPSPSPDPSSPSASRSESGEGGDAGEEEAAPERGSWQGAAGDVTVECRGPAIRLIGATPTSGYAMEQDDTGPDRVRVDFERGDARTRVEATCRAGAPSFSVDADD